MPQEFEITLNATNTAEAHFRLDNAIDENGNPVPHRVDTTGTDYKAGLMTVKGRMPTVVHGFGSDAKGRPYTLVVLEWFAARTTLDLRFREVMIEVSFEAHGKRGKAEEDARRLAGRGASRAYWDPEVVDMAPLATANYYHSTHTVTEKHSLELSAQVKFEPWFSAGPKYVWERGQNVEHHDSVQVTGEFARVKHGAMHNDGARWIMLENASKKSGVPTYMRTAVLLRRRNHDDGQFVGRVKVHYRSSSKFHDVKMMAVSAAGRLPQDQPIIFDPRVQTAVSSFDASNLANIPLQDQAVLVSPEPPAPRPSATDDQAAAAEEEGTGVSSIGLDAQVNITL